MSENNGFRFEELQVYQRALNFANEVYEISNQWPREHVFSLTDQLRRASLSVALNIAEGASRTKLEFKRFITISRGSCHECIPIIEIAFRQKLIDIKRKEVWLNEVTTLSKMLSKLKSSIV
ncbi:four helix bundle protein [Candidatus Microgenomates bacterium]|nr:four helix bundle protein [Candidatus Microgenomates bacterium]